jgi:hypothetical protein
VRQRASFQLALAMVCINFDYTYTPHRLAAVSSRRFLYPQALIRRLHYKTWNALREEEGSNRMQEHFAR